MKKQLQIIIFVFSVVFTTNQAIAQNATKAHKDSLDTMVTKYYDLNLKIFQTSSTLEDIERVFAIFTTDFTYVHPKYGGIYTRKDLYNGYIRNQKDGGYDGTILDIKITNKIIGLNSVVVERSYIEKTADGIKEGTPQMTLFEFKHGKIIKIFEYW